VTLSFIELELWAIEFLHCGNIDFRLFAPVTLTLTWWPSYTNLTRILWRYNEYDNMNFLRQGFRKLSSDRQTDTTEIIYHAASRIVTALVLGRNRIVGRVHRRSILYRTIRLENVDTCISSSVKFLIAFQEKGKFPNRRRQHVRWVPNAWGEMNIFARQDMRKIWEEIYGYKYIAGFRKAGVFICVHACAWLDWQEIMDKLNVTQRRCRNVPLQRCQGAVLNWCVCINFSHV